MYYGVKQNIITKLKEEYMYIHEGITRLTEVWVWVPVPVVSLSKMRYYNCFYSPRGISKGRG